MIKFGRIVLIVFIFVLLVIPLFHMNTSKITEQENRTLVKFPETTKKDKPNYEFGKEFESWLGDRFWGRDQLIDARFQTMYKINGRIENNKAFVGDEGWMFMKDEIINVPSIKKQREKIEKNADILKRFDDKFKGKNIPIYLVLIPDRNQLYQKYWERYYTPKPRLDYGDELIKALKDHPNIHIIYPKEEFMESMEKEDIFFKEDIHLNGYGTTKLLETLLKEIKIKDIKYTINHHPNIKEKYICKILKKNCVPQGVAKELDFSWDNSSYSYKILEKLPKEIDPFDLYERGYSLNPIINKNITLLGVCYGKDALFPVLKNLYRSTERITTWSFKDGNEKLDFVRLDKINKIKSGLIIIVLPLEYGRAHQFLEGKL